MTQIQFEIDDQRPEDLALAVDRLRLFTGVIDVIQIPAFGKKGRLLTQIQLLCAPEHSDRVAHECFRQTTTLGVRVATVDRQILKRSEADVLDVHRPAGTETVRYKRAHRPDGRLTVKAEMDDIAKGDLSHAEREALRRRVESEAENSPDDSK